MIQRQYKNGCQPTSFNQNTTETQKQILTNADIMTTTHMTCKQLQDNLIYLIMT